MLHNETPQKETHFFLFYGTMLCWVKKYIIYRDTKKIPKFRIEKSLVSGVVAAVGFHHHSDSS